MTKEQREAIENLSEINNLSKEELQNENITAILDYTDLKSLDTVLSLIKENQIEIEKYKALYERALSDLVKSDKQIDLMADFMYKTGTGRRALSCMFRQNDECNENGCRYCIKKYFADKAKMSQ